MTRDVVDFTLCAAHLLYAMAFLRNAQAGLVGRGAVEVHTTPMHVQLAVHVGVTQAMARFGGEHAGGRV